MDKILTNYISNSAGMPVVGAHWDFLQNNITTLNTVSIGSNSNYDFVTNNSIPVALYGCVKSGLTSTSVVLTSGAILWKNEIFFIDGGNYTKTSGQTFVLNKVTTFTNSKDPIQYTDLQFHNTLATRKLNVIGTTSFTSDMVDLQLLSYLNASYNDTSITGSGSIFNAPSGVTNCTINSQNVTLDKIGTTITVKGQINYTVNSNSTHQITLNLKSNFYKSTNVIEYYPLTGSYLRSGTYYPFNTQITTGLTGTGTLGISSSLLTSDVVSLYFCFSYQCDSIG